MHTENVTGEIYGLLREWADGLLRLQIDNPACSSLHGAILCPACKTVHGRCHEAVYPLMYMAQATGEEKYLKAARRLFAWGGNMVCTDGAVRNDAKSEWKGVTVFAAVALHDALYYHGSLLSLQEKTEWENRLSNMGSWLYKNLRANTPAYINYYAANACAMALLGRYFNRTEYTDLAGELFAFCMRCVTENGLIYGEGRPTDAVTPKGCRAMDPGGYNVEETLPMLYRYAVVLQDVAALRSVRDLYLAHLEWMLPDGAWDDSVGTRGFKWSYWGSRTADGCQEALFGLGKTEPVFAEAALRNLRLYRRCTHEGLLYGGPDYSVHGEPACVHHTFCRMKTLAAVLESGVSGFSRSQLPGETAPAYKYYAELDTVKITFGGWIADVTGYDFPCKSGKHASGGALSLLWHQTAGPIIAVGAMDHALREPHNQQLPVNGEDTRCPCPRIEAKINGTLFFQHTDAGARISQSGSADAVCVKVNACLCTMEHVRAPEYGDCTLEYTFAKDTVDIRGCVPFAIAENARYILPLIGTRADVRVMQGKTDGGSVPWFHLNPGFMGREYTILPDADGCFAVRIYITEEGEPV